MLAVRSEKGFSQLLSALPVLSRHKCMLQQHCCVEEQSCNYTGRDDWGAVTSASQHRGLVWTKAFTKSARQTAALLRPRTQASYVACMQLDLCGMSAPVAGLARDMQAGTTHHVHRKCRDAATKR